VGRLSRGVWESALPPTILAALDLIASQTLGPNVIWHLVLNYPLGKLYAISLLYTLNSTNAYRLEQNLTTRSRSQDIYSFKSPASKQGEIELGTRNINSDRIRVHKTVTTYQEPSASDALSHFSKAGGSVDARYRGEQ